MRKPYLILSALLLASLGVTAMAQSAGATTDTQSRSRKKVVRYNEATNEVVEVAQPESSAPVYIVNSPKYESAPQAPQKVAAIAAPSVQEQPTTLIEASSLKESKADQLRKSRQDMEVQTEQKIVEKLEEARIQDEKARADRLFGATLVAPLAAPTPAPTPTPAPQIAPPPAAPQAALMPPIVVVEKAESKVEEAEEPATIKEDAKKVVETPKVDQEQKASYFVGGLVGISQYPDVNNVRGTGSGGFTIGTITPEGWVAEGTFMFSTYDLEVVSPMSYSNPYPPFKAVTQSHFSVGAKYLFLSGKLRPSAGILGSYSYRKYTNKQYGYINSDNAATNALDVGVSAGVDLMLTKNFSLGLDFKYLANVAYNTNSSYQQSFVYPQFSQPGTPLEKLDYYTLTLAGKVIF